MPCLLFAAGSQLQGQAQCDAYAYTHGDIAENPADGCSYGGADGDPACGAHMRKITRPTGAVSGTWNESSRAAL